jgi:hypothetical protein
MLFRPNRQETCMMLFDSNAAHLVLSAAQPLRPRHTAQDSWEEAQQVDQREYASR